MLTAFLLTAFLQAPQSLQQQVPTMNHMATDGLINPRQSTLTATWTCPGNPRSSRASLTVTDLRKRGWNHSFKVQAAELRVEGRHVAAAVRREIERGLAELDTLETFLGQCSGRSPGLYIKGHSFDGERFIPRTMRFYLR